MRCFRQGFTDGFTEFFQHDRLNTSDVKSGINDQSARMWLPLTWLNFQLPCTGHCHAKSQSSHKRKGKGDMCRRHAFLVDDSWIIIARVWQVLEVGTWGGSWMIPLPFIFVNRSENNWLVIIRACNSLLLGPLELKFPLLLWSNYTFRFISFGILYFASRSREENKFYLLKFLKSL